MIFILKKGDNKDKESMVFRRNPIQFPMQNISQEVWDVNLAATFNFPV